MTKARLSLLVVAGLLLSSTLMLTAALEASGGKGERIKKLSHTHPDGADNSFFCGKVAGKQGTRYRAIPTGPAVDPPHAASTFKMGKKGVRKVVFLIEAPGTYFLTLKKKKGGKFKFVDKEQYEVPPPPPDGAAEGPFACGGE